MAGFEVVVRPVVFPNIRPAPAQPVAPADDPEKGFAIIHGNGAKQVDLPQSWSASTSSSGSSEVQRRVDTARVYQKKDDGTINRNNFVDAEVVNKLTMKGPTLPSSFKGFTGDDLVPTVPGRGYTGDDIQQQFYKPIKEKDNIEIMKRNQIKRADDDR